MSLIVHSLNHFRNEAPNIDNRVIDIDPGASPLENAFAVSKLLQVTSRENEIAIRNNKFCIKPLFMCSFIFVSVLFDEVHTYIELSQSKRRNV